MSALVLNRRVYSTGIKRARGSLALLDLSLITSFYGFYFKSDHLRVRSLVLGKA